MRFWSIVMLCLVFLLPFQADAETWQGRAVGVADGDTFTLLTAGYQQIKVRLAEIDCPESGQPYGKRAKQELSSLLFQKAVTVEEVDRDRYGRMVGRVFVEGLDVNAEMLRRGAAWVFVKYAKDPTLKAVEQEARTAKRGLWNLPEEQRIPPWEWRHPKQSNQTIPIQGQENKSCGLKKVCRQMTSCEEARYYLEQCGVSSLDGNHDGIPCSKLCK